MSFKKPRIYGYIWIWIYGYGYMDIYIDIYGYMDIYGYGIYGIDLKSRWSIK